MLTRSAASPAATSQRASAMRRMRRRAAGNTPYCTTNGCTTYLTVDAASGVATCPICGLRRHLS
jgi:hypothetical protein